MEFLEQPLDFKFVYIKNGQPTMGRKKAQANTNGLMLNQDFIDYDYVLDTTVRDNRLVILLDPATPLDDKTRKKYLNENNLLILMVTKVSALDLERYIDRHCSERYAKRHQQQLAAEGRADQFRAVRCPHCNAVIDLSEQQLGQYIYCPYCETLLDRQQQIVTSGDSYRICDECNLYARVQGYTQFNFYFLLVFYGWSYRRVHLCDTCVNRVFRRTLITNLPFILGVPFAINMKLKSMGGRDPELKRLADANNLAQKGKVDQLEAAYQEFYTRYPNHPGLLMNQGLSHLFVGDGAAALDFFSRSLRSCSNYEPTVRIMMRLQQASQASQA